MTKALADWADLSSSNKIVCAENREISLKRFTFKRVVVRTSYLPELDEHRCEYLSVFIVYPIDFATNQGFVTVELDGSFGF
jgi:hypothetical protein